MEYRRQDLCKDPTDAQLRQGLAMISAALSQSALLWKLVGGYAVAQYEGLRGTKDLDFALLMPDMTVPTNIMNYVDAMQIPGLHRLRGAGYGLLVDGILLEIDFLDPRLLRSLQGIPKQVWAMDQTVLCAPWLLITKLRTWSGRKQARATAMNPHPGEKDAFDVKCLSTHLAAKRRPLLTEQLVAGEEYAQMFMDYAKDYVLVFETLGWERAREDRR